MAEFYLTPSWKTGVWNVVANPHLQDAVTSDSIWDIELHDRLQQWSTGLRLDAQLSVLHPTLRFGAYAEVAPNLGASTLKGNRTAYGARGTWVTPLGFAHISASVGAQRLALKESWMLEHPSSENLYVVDRVNAALSQGLDIDLLVWEGLTIRPGVEGTFLGSARTKGDLNVGTRSLPTMQRKATAGNEGWGVFIAIGWEEPIGAKRSSAMVLNRSDKDWDEDGITNGYDQCPREAETINGYQDADGCPEAINPNAVPRTIQELALLKSAYVADEVSDDSPAMEAVFLAAVDADSNPALRNLIDELERDSVHPFEAVTQARLNDASLRALREVIIKAAKVTENLEHEDRKIKVAWEKSGDLFQKLPPVLKSRYVVETAKALHEAGEPRAYNHLLAVTAYFDSEDADLWNEAQSYLKWNPIYEVEVDAYMAAHGDDLTLYAWNYLVENWEASSGNLDDINKVEIYWDITSNSYAMKIQSSTTGTNTISLESEYFGAPYFHADGTELAGSGLFDPKDTAVEVDLQALKAAYNTDASKAKNIAAKEEFLLNYANTSADPAGSLARASMLLNDVQEAERYQLIARIFEDRDPNAAQQAIKEKIGMMFPVEVEAYQEARRVYKAQVRSLADKALFFPSAFDQTSPVQLSELEQDLIEVFHDLGFDEDKRKDDSNRKTQLRFSITLNHGDEHEHRATYDDSDYKKPETEGDLSYSRVWQVLDSHRHQIVVSGLPDFLAFRETEVFMGYTMWDARLFRKGMPRFAPRAKRWDTEVYRSHHDYDGDGLNDLDESGNPKDKCWIKPEIFNGVLDNDGCPDYKSLKHQVLFEHGKSTISQQGFEVLNELLKILRSDTSGIKRIRIEGHTDSVGTKVFNLKLSQERADAVLSYLTDRGIPAEKLDAVGFGELRPVDTNRTPEGRANNNRVYFIVIETE